MKLVELLKRNENLVRLKRKYINPFQGKKVFSKNKKMYESMNNDERFHIIKKNIFPIVDDYYQNAGCVDEQYFMQDKWMAKEIYKANPEKHYDVGSKLDSFIAHLLSFREEVTMLDIRPLPFEIDGLKFIQCDATNMKGIEDNSIISLSSLHAIEHFGLGRYGDPIQPDAWKYALRSFQRVLAKGGRLYLSVPVGYENKVCYNAHRIFLPQTICEVFDQLKLVKFAYVQNMKINDVAHDEIQHLVLDEDFLCGLFIFEK